MWQPIETMPTKQHVLMCWSDGMVRIGARYSPYGESFKVEIDMGDASATVYCPRDYLPTHWMPLPEPVKAVSEAA